MERRTAARSRIFKGAKIVFGQGAAIDCVARNLSAAGACLDVASPVGIPEAFTLVLDGNRTSHPCRIIWRTDKRIGVAFD